jgi:cytochrome c oxidase subunit I
VLLLAGWLIGPAESGWTSYPPLSTVFSGDGQTLWAMSLHLLGISSILGAINFIVTILNMRPEGMGSGRCRCLCGRCWRPRSFRCWRPPSSPAALTLLILDRVAGTSFFNPARRRRCAAVAECLLVLQPSGGVHHGLPGFGMLSEVLAVHSRKPIFGYRMIALSSMAIALVGFTVWAHHMFTSLQPELRIPFMITSMIIAVPTGIKIFSWLGTSVGRQDSLHAAMLFSLGFLSMFVIGGIGGVMLASVPVDIHVHDTYFVVSHFHFVLYGGSVFLIFAGIYHWFPKITGRKLNEGLGKLHFWVTYFGFFFTFFPQHIAGLQGMPRRIATYLPEYTDINRLISFASFCAGHRHLHPAVQHGCQHSGR